MKGLNNLCRAFSVAAVLGGTALWSVPAFAGVIVPDRGTLNALLGINAVNEGFENINIPDGLTLWTDMY